MNTFTMPQKVIYGENALQCLGDVTREYCKTVLIVSDNVMKQLGYLDEVVTILEENGLKTCIYTGANTEPTDVYIEEALNVLRENDATAIIAIGGGSCIDTGKATAVMAVNDGYIGDYMKNRKVEVTPLPLIIIPTTAGTGSEVTDVTVINNTKTDTKMMIKQPAFQAKVALVDPKLTKTSPKKVTSSSGLDALCHAMEAYYSRKAQPMTQMYSLSALEKITTYLKTAFNEGDNMKARDAMSLAALEAGVAFSNASVTLIHGMSRPIGALFHVPHGISNAMLLPAILDYTRPAAEQQLAEIYHHLHPSVTKSNAEMADLFTEEVKQLCQDLDIPNLKTWGIDSTEFEKNLDKMADDAIDSGSPANNPNIPTHDEIVELYKVCYNYEYKPAVLH